MGDFHMNWAVREIKIHHSCGNHPYRVFLAEFSESEAKIT
jgi:hypothetical protein